MRTQVCIIGGGPTGLLLSQLLHVNGIDTVVLEKQSREHVLSRIRGGVLERGFARLMHEARCGDRMDREGQIHDGFFIAHNGRLERIDLTPLSGGRSLIVYDQTELTRDLYDARHRIGGKIIHNAEDVELHDIVSDAPFVTFRRRDTSARVDCDYIVGADGFQGVSRRAIPAEVIREYERVYPINWLGVLSRTTAVSIEPIYAKHARGFALCSRLSPSLCRYCIQVPPEDSVEDWPDDAFWAELKRRLPKDISERLITGPSVERSIAPLRSFVAEPMRYKRLFLAGDAAHILPTTGARGLNSAASDVHLLYEGFVSHYHRDDGSGLDAYSDKALSRVWRAQRFSWWMTSLLHYFAANSPYEDRLQRAELSHVLSSETALRSLAESYLGMPYAS